MHIGHKIRDSMPFWMSLSESISWYSELMGNYFLPYFALHCVGRTESRASFRTLPPSRGFSLHYKALLPQSPQEVKGLGQSHWQSPEYSLSQLMTNPVSFPFIRLKWCVSLWLLKTFMWLERWLNILFFQRTQHPWQAAHSCLQLHQEYLKPFPNPKDTYI